MAQLSVSEIGKRIESAGRLKMRSICIYGANEIPEGAVPSTNVSSCLAKAILSLSAHEKAPAMFVGEETIDECCGGGVAMLGFRPHNPGIKFFVSYGSPDFMNGAAEYLRATPELFEENRRMIGKITPPGKYVVIRACADLPLEDPGVRSILVFGVAEQVRNLCALVHFRSRNPFNEVLVPQGPSCASFITYAAGMAENAPKEAVFLGPDDPTGNSWFPESHLSLAIPISMARRMCEDMDQSFIVKRQKVANPARRTVL